MIPKSNFVLLFISVFIFNNCNYAKKISKEKISAISRLQKRAYFYKKDSLKNYIKEVGKLIDDSFPDSIKAENNFGSMSFIMGKYKSIIFEYGKFRTNICFSLRVRRAMGNR